MSWLEHRIPPPAVALAHAGLMWLFSFVGPALPLSTAQRGWASAALVLAGLAFDASALWVFRQARTTVNPLRPERASALVAGGICRITRNPMYVGMALVLCGWAMWLGSWLAWAGPVLFMLYIHRWQVLPEERVLVQHFGAEYLDYQRRVRRWL